MRLLALFLLCASLSLASDIKKEINVSSGKRLDMHLETGGSISISGWEKEAVSVEADLKGRGGKDCKVEIEESKSGVNVESYFERRRSSQSTSIHFEVKVPRRFDLELETNGGGIHIDGVEGTLNGSTMGGELELTNLKGTIQLHTMGGRISLTKSDVDGEVNTNGGKVLLEDVRGNVKGRSMGGAVVYRNVTDRKGDRGEAGDSHDAGRTLVMSSMGGEIVVRSAGEFVKAHTMGGNIHIGAVDGWVKAETMGGDVDVTMTGDPSKGRRDVTIASKGGDVTLTVPPELSMEVEITIAR